MSVSNRLVRAHNQIDVEHTTKLSNRIVAEHPRGVSMLKKQNEKKECTSRRHQRTLREKLPRSPCLASSRLHTSRSTDRPTLSRAKVPIRIVERFEASEKRSANCTLAPQHFQTHRMQLETLPAFDLGRDAAMTAEYAPIDCRTKRKLRENCLKFCINQQKKF